MIMQKDNHQKSWDKKQWNAFRMTVIGWINPSYLQVKPNKKGHKTPEADNSWNATSETEQMLNRHTWSRVRVSWSTTPSGRTTPWTWET